MVNKSLEKLRRAVEFERRKAKAMAERRSLEQELKLLRNPKLAKRGQTFARFKASLRSGSKAAIQAVGKQAVLIKQQQEREERFREKFHSQQSRVRKRIRKAKKPKARIKVKSGSLDLFGGLDF